MSSKFSSSASKATPREDRLKAALKANVAKRKAQARARSGGPGAEDKNSSEPGAARSKHQEKDAN